MKYKIESSENGACVHAKVLNPITMAQTLEMFGKIAQKATEEGKHSILIDTRDIPNTKYFFEDYEIAHKHLRKLGFKLPSRFVMLVTAGDKSHDFTEIVGQNAGFRWRVMTNEDTARDWLNKKGRVSIKTEPE